MQICCSDPVLFGNDKGRRLLDAETCHQLNHCLCLNYACQWVCIVTRSGDNIRQKIMNDLIAITYHRHVAIIVSSSSRPSEAEWFAPFFSGTCGCPWVPVAPEVAPSSAVLGSWGVSETGSLTTQMSLSELIQSTNCDRLRLVVIWVDWWYWVTECWSIVA